MKVFISGPMSGKPYCNRAAFYKAQEDLEKHGYSVWNPAWLAYPNDTEFTKDDMHIIDFAAIRLCDAIYMLKGWKYSKGAQEEHEYAAMRGLTIMYEEECFFSFRFNLSKAPKKNTPVFDQEFAYDESVKNRTNYQLEAIKENIKEKYNTLDRRIKSIEEELAWDKWKNDLPDNFCSNRIDSLEKWRNDFAVCYTVNITNLRKEVDAIKESIGTDNLQEQLEKDFADVYEEFQNTKDQVNDINMGYIKWSSEVSQFDERIEKLEENMKKIAANGGLGLSFNLMNEHVSSNKRDISSIKDSIDNQRCTLDVISERVDKHYKKLNNDIDDIHNWINAHDKMLEAQSKQMSDLGSKLDDYKEAYKHLDNADEALDRRIKALERSRECDWYALQQVRKDVTDLVNTVCDDNRTINNTLTDLSIRLEAVEKRLSIKPFYEPTEDEKDDD